MKISGFFKELGRKLRSLFSSNNIKVRVSSLSSRIKGFFIRLWQSISSLAKKVWAKFLSDKRILACVAASVFIVIAVPIVVAIARPSAPVSENVPEPSAPVVSTLPAESFVPVVSEPTATPVPTPEPTPDYIAPGEQSERVAPVQQRLMELGYMDVDEPTDYYGSQTQESIQIFQQKHDLTADGYAGKETLALLMSDDAKPYVASVGDNNFFISEMQLRLRELWYFNGEATGYFGTETEAAVKLFQEKNDLTADGKIGNMTMEMLYSEEAKANAYAYGESSEGITKYQNRLKKLGYLTTEPDGTYGADTVTAVRRFQSENGLIADGALGRETAALLMSDAAEKSSLKIGSEGRQVENVQNRLIELKYMKKATGYFGSDTETAVREFQKRNGLSVDGKVGPNTLSVLMSDDAKKSSGKSTVSNNDKPSTNKPSNDKPQNNSNNNNDKPAANITGANIDSFISVAKSKLGCRYVRGAKGPNKFDCSGFVYWCLNQVGVKQSYMTSYAWRSCTKYKRIENIDDVRRGDVIIYKMGKTRGHCAIAISDTMMIDASSGNKKVVERSFQRPWSRDAFYCAYRIF